MERALVIKSSGRVTQMAKKKVVKKKTVDVRKMKLQLKKQKDQIDDLRGKLDFTEDELDLVRFRNESLFAVIDRYERLFSQSSIPYEFFMEYVQILGNAYKALDKIALSSDQSSSYLSGLANDFLRENKLSLKYSVESWTELFPEQVMGLSVKRDSAEEQIKEMKDFASDIYEASSND
jgi:hypothetical protein